MNKNAIERFIIEAIQDVAPEIEQNEIDLSADIREECDLDSMDFINYLAALQKSTGVKISEVDYPQLATFNGASDFLMAHLDTNTNSNTKAQG